jgi:hypothetical protein
VIIGVISLLKLWFWWCWGTLRGKGEKLFLGQRVWGLSASNSPGLKHFLRVPEKQRNLGRRASGLAVDGHSYSWGLLVVVPRARLGIAVNRSVEAWRMRESAVVPHQCRLYRMRCQSPMCGSEIKMYLCSIYKLCMGDEYVTSHMHLGILEWALFAAIPSHYPPHSPDATPVSGHRHRGSNIPHHLARNFDQGLPVVTSLHCAAAHGNSINISNFQQL